MYTLTAITANRLEVDLQAPRETTLWGRAPPQCIWFMHPEKKERKKIKIKTQIREKKSIRTRKTKHTKRQQQRIQLHVCCWVSNGFLDYHFSWFGDVVEGFARNNFRHPWELFWLVIPLPAGV